MFVLGEDWVDTGSESPTGATNEAMKETRIQLGISPSWRLALLLTWRDVQAAGRRQVRTEWEMEMEMEEGRRRLANQWKAHEMR